MCSVNLNLSNIQYSPMFRSYETNTVYADKFIEDVKNANEKNIKGSWYSRNLGSTTGSTPFLLALGYELCLFLKANHLKKTLPKEEFKKAVKHYPRNIVLSLAGAFAASIGINKYLNSKTEESHKKILKKFNTLNTQTHAILSDKFLRSGYIGALYNPISGTIMINSSIANDPIMRKNIDKLLKHELTHAKQYEMVARSNNGLKKLNYAVARGLKKDVENIPAVKEYFQCLYADVLKGGNKFNNTKIPVYNGSAEVNLKNYVATIYTLLNNPKAGIDDIPFVIDVKHYQDIIDKSGKLSPNEEKLANQYYQAILNYKAINPINAFNPYGSYRQNLLEKEAYSSK